MASSLEYGGSTCGSSCLQGLHDEGGFPGCDRHCLLWNYSWWGYRPDYAVAIVLVVAFSICTVLHSIIARWWGKRFLSLLAIGGALEIAGWACRIAAHSNPFDDGLYIGQLITLTVAPTFFSAMQYVLMSLAVKRLGTQFSRLSPKMFRWSFIAADATARILQVAGTGAASAMEEAGKDVAAAGLILQAASTAVFVAFCFDVYRRVLLSRTAARNPGRAATGEAGEGSGAGTGAGSARDGLTRASPAGQAAGDALDPAKGQRVGEPRGVRFGDLVFSNTAGSALIFTRCVFRSVEMFGGARGHLAVNQGYVEVLDGLMMALFMVVFLAFHPMRTLGPGSSRDGFPAEGPATPASGREVRQRPGADDPASRPCAAGRV